MSKQYWLDGYNPDNNNPPDCFSMSGIAPEPGSPHKQNGNCATCPQNQWGSVITQAGKKAKACQDNRRIAIVPAGDPVNEVYGGPMLLRVPPDSLRMLDQYCSKLDRLRVDISEVVTQLSFNPEVSHQQIQFQELGWITDPEVWTLVQEQLDSDQVHRILEEGALEEAQDPASHPTAPASPLVQTARPGHLQVVPPTPLAPAPPPPVQPVQAPPSAAQPAPQAKPRVSPFQQAATRAQAVQQPAQVKRAAPQPTPMPQQTPVPAQPAVVQGAPPDMESAIDNLLDE
jgi:hypothetical protein